MAGNMKIERAYLQVWVEEVRDWEERREKKPWQGCKIKIGEMKGWRRGLTKPREYEKSTWKPTIL